MITVTPDATGRAGVAQLRFGGAATASVSPRLRIRRDGWDDGTLGPNGWQGEDAWLQPEAIATDGADLLLTVGWDACQHLQADTYLVSLSHPGTEAPAAWPDIRPVRAASRVRPRGPGAVATGQTSSPGDTGTLPVENATSSIPLIPPAPPTPARLADGQRPAPAGVGSVQGKRRYLAGATVLALLALAGAGYWLWHARSADRSTQVAAASTTPATTPTPVTPAARPPTTPPIARPPVQPLPPAPALSEMNVPDVLAHAPDLAAVTAEGRRRLAGQQHDDGLLLLEEAADRGDGTAMAALGSLYDPVDFQAGGILAHPDARQAARYYQSAERANTPGVAAKRDALRTWLQAKSAAGDLQAGLVLKDFWS